MTKNEVDVRGTSNTFAIVRSLLKEHGLDLSPAGERFVSEAFTDKIKITTGPNSRVTVRDDTQLDRFADLRDRLNMLFAERKELFLVGPGNDNQTSDTDNPWTKAHWNLTRQYMLENTDPEKARQLQAEARQ